MSESADFNEGPVPLDKVVEHWQAWQIIYDIGRGNARTLFSEHII